MRSKRLSALLCAAAVLGCVSGNKIRADAEVIQADVERARRSNAMKCAPRELAIAEANLDFALGELAEGNSFRAGEHIRDAEGAIKKALALSKDCGPKQVVIREKEPEQTKPPPVVVKIEATDKDRDTVPDLEDKCPDKFGPPENNGCPQVTNLDTDGDGVVDTKDKCDNTPGPIENLGCPDTDKDGDGVADRLDRCPDKTGPSDNAGCPESDRDEDGVPDRTDKCPDQPGVPNLAGCPDPNRDTDGDGIADRLDKCPDKTGPIENAGCPDADKDGDTLLDRLDKCPDKPGPAENNGCPDDDKDGDGVVDRLDKCPDQPGVTNLAGCPDPNRDTDGDGIPDRLDKCPEKTGPAETDGCPDPDRDGDGIPDRLDKCPEETGVKEEGGCPKKYKMVVVKKDRIEIKRQIKFKSGSAKIIGKDSFEVIRDVAQALRDNPHIKKIRIEGHTDSVGNDATNLRLSQNRADAVKAELVKDGIDPARMDAVGYGETRPIASNNTKAGRAENRRTEFNIVEQ